MQWVASTLHTTSQHAVSSITTADAHTSAASSRLNWRPPADLNGLVRLSARRNLVFLRVCHHISNAVYCTDFYTHWQGESLVTASLLPGYCMVTAWSLPSYWLVLSWLQSVTTWYLPIYYLVTSWLLPGYCMVTEWLMPGLFLVTAWLLPAYILVTAS